MFWVVNNLQRSIGTQNTAHGALLLCKDLRELRLRQEKPVKPGQGLISLSPAPLAEGPFLPSTAQLSKSSPLFTPGFKGTAYTC